MNSTKNFVTGGRLGHGGLLVGGMAAHGGLFVGYWLTFNLDNSESAYLWRKKLRRQRDANGKKGQNAL